MSHSTPTTSSPSTADQQRIDEVRAMLSMPRAPQRRWLPRVRLFKLLDGHLLKEMVLPFIIGIVIFLLLMMGSVLFHAMDLIVNKGVSPWDLILFLVYRVPSLSVYAFGGATLLGTSLCLNRMARDSEIVAWRTGGVSLFRLLRPIFCFATAVSILAWTLNERIAPETTHRSENIWRRIILKSPLPLIQEEKYFQVGDRHFYVRKIDVQRNILYDLMIYEREVGQWGYPRVTLARRARQENGVWVLYDVITHEYDNQGRQVKEVHSRTAALNLKPNENIIWTDQRSPQEMPTDDLRKQIDMLQESGVRTYRMEVEYHLRQAVPAACLVVALIAAPLTLRFAAGGNFVGLLIAALLAYAFNGTIGWTRALGLGGKLDPITAAWAPNVLYGVVGLLLLLRER